MGAIKDSNKVQLLNDIFTIRRDNISELLSLTESPIERLFLLQLLRYIESALKPNLFNDRIEIDGFYF